MKGTAPEADWLAWGLQFVSGAVVGGGIALVIAVGPRYSRGWTHEPSLPVMVLGMLLLGGGAATVWGDRLWMGRSSWFERRPKHTAFSLGLARVVFFAGIGSVVAACGWRVMAG